MVTHRRAVEVYRALGCLSTKGQHGGGQGLTAALGHIPRGVPALLREKPRCRETKAIDPASRRRIVARYPASPETVSRQTAIDAHCTIPGIARLSIIAQPWLD